MTVEEEDTHKHYKRSRLHDRKFVFASRVVNKFHYLEQTLQKVDRHHADNTDVTGLN